MSRRVYGAYKTEEAAIADIDVLNHCGYELDEIEVISEDDFKIDVKDFYELDLWREIKDDFVFEKCSTCSDQELKDIKAMEFYKEDLEKGKYLILVNEEGPEDHKSVFEDIPVPEHRTEPFCKSVR